MSAALRQQKRGVSEPSTPPNLACRPLEHCPLPPTLQAHVPANPCWVMATAPADHHPFFYHPRPPPVSPPHPWPQLCPPLSAYTSAPNPLAALQISCGACNTPTLHLTAMFVESHVGLPWGMPSFSRSDPGVTCSRILLLHTLAAEG